MTSFVRAWSTHSLCALTPISTNTRMCSPNIHTFAHPHLNHVPTHALTPSLTLLTPHRHLFERVVSLKLSSKKMKYFFKRYLEFEKEHGTDATVDHVKKRAREYVESKMQV